MNIVECSEHKQRIAWKILEDNRIIPQWESIGADVYIVGSLRTGLLVHRDIDMHIYSDTVSVSDSFSVMSALAGRMELKSIQYGNLIHTEEECIEWHSLYEDQEGNTWKFDMIHIRRGSKYDGVVEKVTEAIRNKLTPEIRETILRIKSDMPAHAIIPGIEVYHAVFTGNVKSYTELLVWRESHPLMNSLEWMP